MDSMKIYKGPSTSKWTTYNFTELVALGYTFWISLEKPFVQLVPMNCSSKEGQVFKVSLSHVLMGSFLPSQVDNRMKSPFSHQYQRQNPPILGENRLEAAPKVAENWKQDLYQKKQAEGETPIISGPWRVMFQTSPKKKHIAKPCLSGATREPWN